jgi:zinc/manganese transport system substrate-binding protein
VKEFRPDPHFWLDPLAMKPIVIALTKMLGNDFNIDVNERAKDIAGRLDALDAEIKGMAAAVPVENRKLVTGHESMGYFAARYDFKLIGVIIPGLTTQADVKAVFTELGTPAAVANVIGRETGVKVIPLSTHLLPPDGSYFTFMRNLAIVVTAALL